MTDPFDGLRRHGRRTPPSLDPVQAAGTRRRRQLIGWGSGGVTAAVAAVAVVVTMSGGPATAGRDTLGSDPGATVTPTAVETPTEAPTPTSSPSPAATATTAAAGSARVSLSFATGTSDGLYGTEHHGDTGTSGFSVVRVDPATLAVQRSALIPGTEGGLAVDNQAVYVTAVDGTSVLRYGLADLKPLSSWQDPLGKLAGPVVSTRSGLWVADSHGLTRLTGDGQAAGDTAERSPDRILLAPGYGPEADDFWAVVLDDQGCPTLHHAVGTTGVESAVVHRPDCSLGFHSVVATSGGVLVSTPTGSMGYVSLLASSAAGWQVRTGPGGSNSITPSVAGARLFASYQGQLMCLGHDASTLATVPVQDSGIAQVLRAGGRDLLVVDGASVTPYTPDPACG